MCTFEPWLPKLETQVSIPVIRPIFYHFMAYMSVHHLLILIIVILHGFIEEKTSTCWMKQYINPPQNIISLINSSLGHVPQFHKLLTVIHPYYFTKSS